MSDLLDTCGRKVLLYDFSFCFSYSAYQLFQRCFLDAFHALELLEQGGFCLLANAFYFVQCRCNLPFAALVAVEGDGKTVYLILYLRQQAEEGGILFQPDGLGWKAVEQFRSAVLAVFGKAGNGDIQL